MSQADQNIVAPAAADKAETVIGAALAAARKSAPKNNAGKKPSGTPQPAPAPVRRDTRQVITLASAGTARPHPRHDDQALPPVRPRPGGRRRHRRQHPAEPSAAGRGASLLASATRRWKCTSSGSSAPMSGPPIGAAQFFDGKRAVAKDMASKMNDERDEDRDGPSGFESRVERAQGFAAEMARQSSPCSPPPRVQFAAYERDHRQRVEALRGQHPGQPGREPPGSRRPRLRLRLTPKAGASAPVSQPAQERAN